MSVHPQKQQFFNTKSFSPRSIFLCQKRNIKAMELYTSQIKSLNIYNFFAAWLKGGYLQPFHWNTRIQLLPRISFRINNHSFTLFIPLVIHLIEIRISTIPVLATMVPSGLRSKKHIGLVLNLHAYGWLWNISFTNVRKRIKTNNIRQTRHSPTAVKYCPWTHSYS